MKTEVERKIPVLKLDLGCMFTATCLAYIEFTICLRIHHNEDKKQITKIYNSAEFEVNITGDKLLFHPLAVTLPDELQEPIAVRTTRSNITITRYPVLPFMKYVEFGDNEDEHGNGWLSSIVSSTGPIPYPLNEEDAINATDDIEDWIKLEPKDIKDTRYFYPSGPEGIFVRTLKRI